MSVGARRGFSLIEVLVVIAIIAILAAIIFPTLEAVRRRTREAACMTQMHDIWQKLAIYKEDEGGKAPPALFGYAENPDGSFNTTGSGFVEADRIVNGYLFGKARRNAIPDSEKFHCPVNTPPRKDQVTVAYYPPAPPQWPAGQSWIGARLSSLGCPSDANGVIDCWYEVPSTDPRYLQPKYFYIWDSYDIGPRIGADGRRVPGVFDRHYSIDWTGGSGPQDLPVQLKYPNPDAGKTLVTYCTWHAALSGADKFPTINLAGQARTVPYREILSHGANYFNR